MSGLLPAPGLMPPTHREFHNLKFGHADHADAMQRPQRNARVDALLNFYGLFDGQVPLFGLAIHSAEPVLIKPYFPCSAPTSAEHQKNDCMARVRGFAVHSQ